VNERWVCKRCFADNTESDSTCTRCGLLRGADATAADQSGWASRATTAPSERPAWQGLLRFWWIPVLVISLAVGWYTSARRDGDGALTSAGTVGAAELRVGDCFNAGDETEITEVNGIPCDEPHAYEVFAVADEDRDTFPTDADLDAIFTSMCVPAFEPYVGAPYSTSEIYATMMSPTQSSWDDGDREFTCFLFEPANESLTEELVLTESMRGAGR
jgi:hypothetical protein